MSPSLDREGEGSHAPEAFPTRVSHHHAGEAELLLGQGQKSPGWSLSCRARGRVSVSIARASQLRRGCGERPCFLANPRPATSAAASALRWRARRREQPSASRRPANIRRTHGVTLGGSWRHSAASGWQSARSRWHLAMLSGIPWQNRRCVCAAEVSGSNPLPPQACQRDSRRLAHARVVASTSSRNQSAAHKGRRSQRAGHAGSADLLIRRLLSSAYFTCRTSRHMLISAQVSGGRCQQPSSSP